MGWGRGASLYNPLSDEDERMYILNAAFAAAQGLVEAAGSALGSGFIAEFVRSESGEVSPKQGFPVAWTGGLLVAAMVVLGSPPQAAAHCPYWAYKNCSSTAQCNYYCGIAHHGCEGTCVNYGSAIWCHCG